MPAKKQTTTTTAKRETAAKNINKITKRGRGIRAHTLWTTTTFSRAKPQHLPKSPKYLRRALPKERAADKYQVLQHPKTLQNPKVSKAIEDNNTISFVVDLKATKKSVKKAFTEMTNQKVAHVRTVITARGQKVALIKLPESVEAVEVATQIGLC